MSKIEFDCGKWLQEAEEFALPNWSALPSIPLYMDQVMMFTGEALSLFERDEKQSLLTNSMINNYVKSGVEACSGSYGATSGCPAHFNGAVRRK